MENASLPSVTIPWQLIVHAPLSVPAIDQASREIAEDSVRIDIRWGPFASDPRTGTGNTRPQ